MFGSILLAGSIVVAPIATPASDDAVGTISAARQAAHDDRNSESAKLFEKAVMLAPERRAELLPELADQLTYSGDGTKAIPLYREALASHDLSADASRHAELGLGLALSWTRHLSAARATYRSLLVQNPRDVDALLGDARVLSWENQLSPSLREYRSVAMLQPQNREALDNIARLENWRGRRHLAERDARALLAKDPSDRSAALTLVQSELWLGRPDLASRDSRSLLAVAANDSSALSFSHDVADASRVRSQFSTNIGTQSDGLIIRDSDFETEVPFASGLDAFGVRYQPISYVGQNTAGDATERRSGVFARARLNDYAEIHATASNDEISATSATTRNLLIYNTYLTLWPTDTLRFDIGSRKETFDNLTSLRMGITAVSDSASVDFTPDEDTRFSARAYHGNISDGNTQQFQQFEFERTIDPQPHVALGTRLTNYSFGETLNNGYFDPPHYQSAELTAHAYGNVHGRLYYDASGTYGREWVLDGGARPSHSQHAAVSYVFDRQLSLTALYDAFDTLQVSNGGFARTVFGVRLETRW